MQNYMQTQEIKLSTSSCIFFDIETNGLIATADILEIGAVWGDKKFDVYIIPQNPISKAASAVNNITMVNNILYYKNKKVGATSLKMALEMFLAFLREVPEPRILVGHNIKVFDCRFIFSALSKFNLLQNLGDLIAGFIDTLPLYKEFNPSLPNYQQGTIVRKLLNLDYEEHNALHDVLSLQKVFYYSSFDEYILRRHLFSYLDMKNKLLEKENEKVLIEMRNNPRIKLPLTDFMIGKIIKAGLNYNDLELSFKKNGRTGLQELLQGQPNGTKKITTNRKVVDDLNIFFMKLDE